MRAIATIMIVVILISVLSVPVQAKTSDWLKLALALGVIAVAGGGHGQSTYPQEAAPEPLLPSQRLLGCLLIREVSGSSNTRWVAGEVLSAAGWQVIYDEDRRTALDEQRRYGGSGQVAPASFFASVRSDFRQGREYDRGQYGRSYSSGNGGREVVCTVYLRIADGTGRTLQAIGSGSSWSRYDRFDWRSRRYGSSSRDYVPNDQDLALLAAMVAASNQVVRQLSPASGSMVPKGPASTVGTPVGYCPSCGGQAPTGANFCPKCGKQLPH